MACHHMGQLCGSTPHLHRLHVIAAAASPRAAPLGGGGRAAKGSKTQSTVQVDTARLHTDATYQPKRQTGPIDVVMIKGKGRGIAATRDISKGELLMVSAPVGGIVSGAPGRMPADEVLLELLQGQALSPADRYRLSMLCDGTPASLQRSVTLNDLSSEERAGSKGTKSAAAVRGFGAAAKEQQQKQQGSELDGQRMAGVVALNAFGEEMADPGVAGCRGEPLDSYLGIWPEFALVNHSCAPNAAHLLVGHRMLLRAAGPVTEDVEVTISYLGGAAGVPLAQRRQMLQSVSGFECQCIRCQIEARAPEPIQQQLAAMHEWSMEKDAVNAAYAAEPGSAAAAELAAQARFLVEALEVELGRYEGMGPEERALLRASAYGVFQAMHVAGEGGDTYKQPSRALELLMLTQVFMPSSLPALSLATEALERTSEMHGAESKEAKDVLNLLMETYVQRYGETPVEVFYKLLEARCRISSYFGRLDATGLLGQATPAADTAAAAAAGGGDAGATDGEAFAAAASTAAQRGDAMGLFQAGTPAAAMPRATAAQLQQLLDSSHAAS